MPGSSKTQSARRGTPNKDPQQSLQHTTAYSTPYRITGEQLASQSFNCRVDTEATNQGIVASTDVSKPFIFSAGSTRIDNSLGFRSMSAASIFEPKMQKLATHELLKDSYPDNTPGAVHRKLQPPIGTRPARLGGAPSPHSGSSTAGNSQSQVTDAQCEAVGDIQSMPQETASAPEADSKLPSPADVQTSVVNTGPSKQCLSNGIVFTPAVRTIMSLAQREHYMAEVKLRVAEIEDMGPQPEQTPPRQSHERVSQGGPIWRQQLSDNDWFQAYINGPQMVTHCANAMDYLVGYNPEIFQMPHGTQVLNIKVDSLDQMVWAMTHRYWTAIPGVNKRIMEAWQKKLELGSQVFVFLLFSVSGTKSYCGLAQLEGPVDPDDSIGGWKKEGCEGTMPIRFIFAKNVPFSHFEDIQNGYNGQPVLNMWNGMPIPDSVSRAVVERYVKYPFQRNLLVFPLEEGPVPNPPNVAKGHEEFTYSRQGGTGTYSEYVRSIRGYNPNQAQDSGPVQADWRAAAQNELMSPTLALRSQKPANAALKMLPASLAPMQQAKTSPVAPGSPHDSIVEAGSSRTVGPLPAPYQSAAEDSELSDGLPAGVPLNKSPVAPSAEVHPVSRSVPPAVALEASSMAPTTEDSGNLRSWADIARGPQAEAAYSTPMAGSSAATVVIPDEANDNVSLAAIERVLLASPRQARVRGGTSNYAADRIPDEANENVSLAAIERMLLASPRQARVRGGTNNFGADRVPFQGGQASSSSQSHLGEIHGQPIADDDVFAGPQRQMDGFVPRPNVMLPQVSAAQDQYQLFSRDAQPGHSQYSAYQTQSSWDPQYGQMPGSNNTNPYAGQEPQPTSSGWPVPYNGAQFYGSSLRATPAYPPGLNVTPPAAAHSTSNRPAAVYEAPPSISRPTAAPWYPQPSAGMMAQGSLNAQYNVNMLPPATAADMMARGSHGTQYGNLVHMVPNQHPVQHQFLANGPLDTQVLHLGSLSMEQQRAYLTMKLECLQLEEQMAKLRALATRRASGRG